jgi:D-alanyl-D-alanine carboxypeptidase/D-alanyl-D-alanine-endopeptidase (penicillin-binding protein 4)
VTTIAEGRTKLRLEAKLLQNKIELDLSGQIRNALGTWDLRRRVDDPTRYAAEVFKRALADHGVKLRSRAIAFGTVPINLKQIAVHDSPTLGDVVRAMNKHSDNNIAETVLKTLGAETKTTQGPATWNDGLAALRAQLQKLALPGAFKVENGSGLYASTEVSPKQLVTLLAAAHADYRIGPDLVASLPVGGYDGTLARRWIGRPAQGRVRAKTGTLDKVSTLAGYIGVDGGRLLAFAILVNEIPPGQRGHARAMVDDMVDSLAAYLDAK